MSRWAMNCTIWRSMSTSAPFSASSANAIVGVVVIVVVSRTKLLGRTSTLSGLSMATPVSGRLDLWTYTTCWDITAASSAIFMEVSWDASRKKRGARAPRHALPPRKATVLDGAGPGFGTGSAVIDAFTDTDARRGAKRTCGDRGGTWPATRLQSGPARQARARR